MKGEVVAIYNFGLLNIEERFQNTKAVKSPKLKESHSRDTNQGLFSQVIFGPTNSWKCACGQLRGVMAQGQVCPNCNVMVQSSEARRTTFGKIQLDSGMFLINPVAFKLLTNNCCTDSHLRNKALSILTGKEWYNKVTGKYTKLTSDNSYTGPYAFKEIIYPEIIANIRETNDDSYIINTMLPKVEECLFTTLIPVIPPDLRPMVDGVGSTRFMDDINRQYMIMLNYVKWINESPVVPHDKLALLQQQYFNLSDVLLKRLSSKTGVLRKYILGKRVDYSCRAVIVPDATLNLDQVDVSFYIIKEVFKPLLLSKFAKKLNISELEALNSYDNVEYEEDLYEISQCVKGHPVIFNRQPTLHRCSVITFYVRNVTKDYVFAISPLSTDPFNADFDGDQMAAYFPIGGAAYNESLNMLPYKNIYLPSNGEMAFQFKEDLVLGIYKVSLTQEGRDALNNLIPEKARKYAEEFMTKPITGKALSKLTNILIDKIPALEFAEMINNMAIMSHNEAKVAVSLTDFATAKKDDLTNQLSLIIEAGARGKWDQVRQIIETRGFVSDVEGKVIPTAIQSSLLEGLTMKEYFTSAYGGLKGLIDTARNTSMSGYLTRRLVYLISNIELSDTVQDCGSNEYLKMPITDDNATILLYRVAKFDPQSSEEIIITKDNYKELIGKQLYIRSPLLCQCPKDQICHKCYGYLFKKLESRQIGYMAAQSIGERTSQLTLRTKHTSGATNITLPNWLTIEDGIVKTDKLVYIISSPESCTIIDSSTGEEVDFPYSSIEIICENYKYEVIKEDTGRHMENETYEVGDEEEIIANTIDDTSLSATIKYTILDRGEIAKIQLTAHDVIAAVSEFSRLIKNLPKKISENASSVEDVLFLFTDKLGLTDIHSVHYELLLSMFCRKKDDPTKLHRYYPKDPHIWFKESEVLDNMLLQSLVFERLNQKLPKLLLHDPSTLNWKSSIFLQLTSFNFPNKTIYSDPNVNIIDAS